MISPCPRNSGIRSGDTTESWPLSPPRRSRFYSCGLTGQSSSAISRAQMQVAVVLASVGTCDAAAAQPTRGLEFLAGTAALAARAGARNESPAGAGLHQARDVPIGAVTTFADAVDGARHGFSWLQGRPHTWQLPCLAATFWCLPGRSAPSGIFVKRTPRLIRARTKLTSLALESAFLSPGGLLLSASEARGNQFLGE
jgi:hypothetical protein